MAKTVEKWGTFETAVNGPAEGNPFTDHEITAVFRCAEEEKKVRGFYDGDGIYQVRFMPSFTGQYTYEIRADFLTEAQSGSFSVTEPSEANHGPVHVAFSRHFAYEDGLSFYPVGTTCYALAYQKPERIDKTMQSLETAEFNKIRFCVFPKHYKFNLHEPDLYPYEGTPVDTSEMDESNFQTYDQSTDGNHFDYMRINVRLFQRLDRIIQKLQELGIEADLIMMHPYDRWGFSCMTREEDDLYWNYAISRLAAFRNVWWSLANEYDLMKYKNLKDWEHFGALLMECDPYHHLRSIHQCYAMYDHSRSWVTHCSVQSEPSVVNALLDRYNKPVIIDECGYEGTVPYSWGCLTSEEMTRRMWDTVMRGGYPGHSETLLTGDYTSLDDPSSANGRTPEGLPKQTEVLWWSHGGKLNGSSWKRAEFLLKILENVPGHGLRLYQDLNGYLSACPDSELLDPVKSYYLYYTEGFRPMFLELYVDDGTDFHVEIIDTWNMTVTDGGVHSGHFRVPLGGKPYMAVILRRK